MSHSVALSFEDGVTRFITCGDNETVADASYKARINIPLDCRDGACGTCKAFCESGEFDQREYIEDALSDDELEQGYCLPCQMVPQSDLVIQIAATSDVAKTAAAAYDGTLTDITRHSDGMVSFTVDVPNRDKLAYLPGQYMNLTVPGSRETRSYSFSSAPGDDTLGFLVRIVNDGLMSTWLRDRAQVGDRISLTGPFGSFFLRELKRPTLLLAGGSGIAPLRAMLRKLKAGGSLAHSLHLIMGINVDADLVYADELDALAAELDGFTWEYVVADKGSSHRNIGFVTSLMDEARMANGDLDVYLCGPPLMVEAVREHFKANGITPAGFYFEKFNTTSTQAAPTTAPAAAPAPAPSVAAAAAEAAEPGAEPALGAEEPAAEKTPAVGVAAPATSAAAPAATADEVPSGDTAPAAPDAPQRSTQTYEIGEEHRHSDALFDARTALELGVMELTIGRLTLAQVNGYHRLAVTTKTGVEGDRFTDAVAFTEINNVFHEYPFLFTGNDHLLQAFRRLGVKGHMNEVLSQATWCHPDIVHEHLAIVEAFELDDRAKVRELIQLHAAHSKETMHRAMKDAGQ